VQVKGVPVLFIPGNAGSYRQARSTAGEAASYYHNVLRHDPAIATAGVRTLDFFTVDFNEEFTAFHGQAILDQAEYLNEAVAYILSLYHDPRRSERDPDLPDPTSVMILGHSMGGIVARTMLVMPNYQSNSINTIITLAAPHARPPVSFDAEIVNIYKDINDYWRQAYSQQWANNNPLWHVTLISIAGGGLDTMIPSDYTSLESLVPETHGFTVFTSTVPTVWTGIDHEAILWSDQLRKVVVKALYDIVDVNRAAQTKPRAERMRVFKKWFLTGMESVAEKTLPQKDPTTLLTLEDNSNSIIPQGERLTLRKFGQSRKPRAHLLPIPPQGTPGGKRFTLLSDQKLDQPGQSGNLEVLFCSVFPLHPGQSATLFSMNMDLSGDSSGSTRLACKNAAADVIILPASTRTSKRPFRSKDEDLQTFSYLQFDLEDISDHQFVAVVDKALIPTPGWVVAEFNDNVLSRRIRHLSLRRLLAFGMKINLPPNRPMVMEVKIPALQSSLLAYHLDMGHQACDEEGQLFTPFLRQYLSEPYESKFFVNVKQAAINLHGIAPFMPPPLNGRNSENGLSLQIWTDPTCNSSIQMSLKVDIVGSVGKLFMRYRTVLAAFPLLIVALVIRKQFRVYDETGVFISFLESTDACLRRSIPLVFFALSLMAFSMASSSVAPQSTTASNGVLNWRGNGTEPVVDYKKNDLLLGSQDPFFWFLVPFIGLMCTGVCVIINYVALGLIHASAIAYAAATARPAWLGKDEKRKAPLPAFCPSSPRRRLFTTGILLFLVSTFIPYQFAYLVACLVQIATCIRALRLARDSRSGANYNFYNYAHSILILMLWTIPAINLPILVVWVHNLAVQWLTPFSSHHNVLSIMPFILLVETLTSGKMVPRVTSRLRHVTSVIFFGTAIYAAVYGVTYAYMLHHLVNLAVSWLVAIHSSTSSWTLASLSTMFNAEDADDKKRGKIP
jgi:glycosylphosphatidylinositol deacylase